MTKRDAESAERMELLEPLPEMVDFEEKADWSHLGERFKEDWRGEIPPGTPCSEIVSQGRR